MTSTALRTATEPSTEPEDQDEEVSGPPSRDTVFSLLSNRRRRTAIEVLRERDGSATVSDLATIVAAREHGVEPANLEAKQRKRVYVALKQVHLPRLDDEGVIIYDDEDNTVALADDVAELEPFLDADESTEPWPYVYLGVAAATTLLLATALTGVVPVGIDAVAATTVSAFVLTALAHVATESR